MVTSWVNTQDFFVLINLHIYSTIKQNEMLPSAVPWIYLKKNISSEVSQSKNYIIYKQNLRKIIQMNLFTKQKQTHRKEKKKTKQKNPWASLVAQW